MAAAGTKGSRNTSTATGSTGCDGTTSCQAQISADSSTASAAPGAKTDQQSATTTASVSAMCDNGTQAGCATRTSSRTDAVGGAAVTAHSTATCSAAGACQAATGGFAARGVAEVTGSCAGTGCRTHTEGTARATAPGGVNKASSRTDCTAGKNGECAASSRVGATTAGTEVSAACEGSKGSTCRYAFSASSNASSATGGHRATAEAGCGDSGGAGSGWCSTSAVAQATPGSAMAAASCQGSSGSGCRYSYRAESHASAAGASADAVGFQQGTVGGGQVTTTAMASGDANSAQASASCTGTDGTSCSHRYEATRSAFAGDPNKKGSWASAYAHGSGGGGMGGGGVAVSASAYVKGNHASASATCTGANNCSAPFEAHAKDRKTGGGRAADWYQDGGYHDASHQAECSGNNGGCGVTAFAIPGHANGGDAVCTGYCENFSHSGTNTWIKTADAGWKLAKAAGVAIDPKTHEPIIDPKTGKPKMTIGKNRYGAEGTCDKNGECKLSVRDLGDKENGDPVTCTAPCKPLRGEDGQRVYVDDKGNIQVRTPTVPDGKKYDEATDPKSAGSYRDDKGRGMGWAATTGSIKDAFTGSHATAKGGGGVTAAYGSKSGRFAVACPSGCVGVLSNGQTNKGKVVADTFDIGGKNGKNGTDAWLVARDKFNNPAVASWNGEGRFTSFEGVTMVAKGDGPTLPRKGPGAAFEWTPNTAFVQTAGLGNPHGRFEINGQSGYVRLADGRKIENNYRLDGCKTLECKPSTKGAPTAADRIVAITPDAKGKGGSFDCVGRCAETVPGNSKVELTVGTTSSTCALLCGEKSLFKVEATERICSARCAMHDEFAGNKDSKTPNGYFEAEMLEAGDIASFTPQADVQYCSGKGCGFVQGYRDATGNGGFGYCTGGDLPRGDHRP